MKTHMAATSIALALTFPSAADTSRDSTSRALISEAYSKAPATFESHTAHGRLSTELCFDRCYVFVGNAGEAAAYWDFVLVSAATIAKWNLPEPYHQQIAAAADSITRSRAAHQCIGDAAGCAALALARQAHVQLSEVTRDEGNVCSVPVDLTRSFDQMKAVTSGPTKCRKAPGYFGDRGWLSEPDGGEQPPLVGSREGQAPTAGHHRTFPGIRGRAASARAPAGDRHE